MGIHRRRLCTGTVIQHTATETAGIPVTQLPPITLNPFQSPFFTLTPTLSTSVLARMNTPLSQRPTSTVTLSDTPIPSFTHPKPTNTLAVTPTAPPKKMQYEQLDIADNIPSNKDITGTLILSVYYRFGPWGTPEKDLNTDSYLLDMSTGKKIVFAKKMITSGLMMYLLIINGWLIIKIKTS